MGAFRRITWSPPAWLALCAAALVIALLASPGCDRSDQRPTVVAAKDVAPIRRVRVLIASRAQRLRVRSDSVISVRTDKGVTLDTYGANDWLLVESTSRQTLRFGGDSLSADHVTLIPQTPGGSITLSVFEDDQWTSGFRYPGSLSVTLDGEGSIDVINLVDIESYVAAVVAGEVWPTFATEAFRGQAIISRTFVLYQMRRRQRAAFDVVATQAAQVYRGLRTDTTGRRAAEAARYTRGIVCTWQNNGEDRLFSTYYSAACGGESQSAAIFGTADAIEPLSGGVHCDYCKIAPGNVYRWGPIRVPVETVQSRLVLRYPELASLGRLAAITTIECAPSGRPVRLRLTGENGEVYDKLAERFRLAIGPNLIRSTDCAIRLAGGEVVFEDGRGFGHGLGLCQWGMQGQALAGRKAGEILRYYYPRCRLTRVY